LTPAVTPELHPLHVEIYVEQKGGEHRSRLDYVDRLSLEQAVADTNRLLIWGDLGAGKSTLVGMFAER
jgi:polynucleotide 5'-kinase involved in rRNA processing